MSVVSCLFLAPMDSYINSGEFIIIFGGGKFLMLIVLTHSVLKHDGLKKKW